VTTAIAWLPEHWSRDLAGVPNGEFLWCLRDTQPADRQVVWEGAHGRGVVAVVDWGVPNRRTSAGRYERWGVVTALTRPISKDAVQVDPILRSRFTRPGSAGLQGGPLRLTQEETEAIVKLAGGDWPKMCLPTDRPSGREREYIWTGRESAPPEKMIEEVVAVTPRLWRRLGFGCRPLLQRALPSRQRPDLTGPPVVAEAKRRIRSDDGPAQIERYLDELRITKPQYPWRGVLLQAVTVLDDAARERLGACRESGYDIEAWAITRGAFRRWRADRLFP
jgi:hypothetical protein